MISFDSSSNRVHLPCPPGQGAAMAGRVDRLDVEELAREVERHRPLWDAACESYAIKHERDKHWEEVIARFLPDYQERSKAERAEIGSLFRRRWKSMRTCYARELNRQKRSTGYRRQYLYYDLLRFLDPVTKTMPPKDRTKAKKPKGNAGNSVESEAAEEDAASVPKEETKTVNKQQPRGIATPKRRNPAHDEADRMFLMSLVPDFQNVPGRNKVRLKMEILQAISRAQEEYYRTPSTSTDVFDFAEANSYADLRDGAEVAGGSFMDFAEVKLEAADYSSNEGVNSPESSFAGD